MTGRKKKKHTAFKYVTTASINYTQSDQKAIIGTFTAACLKAFVVMLGTKSKTPPFRLGKVLLEDKEEAKHQQVKTFLSMMGCTDVTIIDPDLAKVIDYNKKNTMLACTKNIFDVIKGVSFPTFGAVSCGHICSN